MDIYFDYQIFYLQQYGGISRYFLELATELNLIKDCKATVHASIHRNEYVPEKSKGRFVKSIYKYSTTASGGRLRVFGRINNLIRNFLVSSSAEIIFHETYYTNCIQKEVKHRVITIHDMIPEVCLAEVAEFKPVIEYKKRAIERANAIIVDSESTKNDLIKLYPASAQKVHVVYLGVSAVDISMVPEYKSEVPYVLYVGNREFHKNFSTLFNAYSKDESINKKYKLICFGGGKFSAEEMNLIKNNNLGERIIQLSGDDVLLNSLYKSAMCFVMPSFYEGFGIPVLEAMIMQCPVVCSNKSSLPEVAGEAALMIDPMSETEMRLAIKKIADNESLRKELIAKGLENIEKFTWKICAQNTYKVYQTLLEKDSLRFSSVN